MKIINKNISILLLISMILLSILVPGGPIETRNFSQIAPVILGLFNIFLTSLGIVSILLIFFIQRNIKWSFLFSAICGLMYFLVYILDLSHIFPVSPDKMPILLLTIEIIGTILSIPLMYLSLIKFTNIKRVGENATNKSENLSKNFKILFIFLIILGLGIVIFATKSAMGI